MMYLSSLVIQRHSRRRRHWRRVASSGRCVAPPWPRRMACLQRLAGTDSLSLPSWFVQRARGRPGRRLHPTIKIVFISSYHTDNGASVPMNQKFSSLPSPRGLT